MTTQTLAIEKGSFRDPSGYVFAHDNQIFRAITQRGSSNYLKLKESGLIDKLIKEGRLVATEEVNKSSVPNLPENIAYVVQHQKLPFISYPYEWGFENLKAAALFHLDFHLRVLESGFTLSDATAYNVQFVGAKPVFIDLLSIVPYQEGEYWMAHRQFCEQFIAPLVLRAYLGITHNAWYRGNQEGISVNELRKILPLKAYFSLNMWIHIILQADLQQRRINEGVIDKASHQTKASGELTRRPMPLAGYKQMLTSLRKWIATLTPKDRDEKSIWGDYASTNTYNAESRDIKKEFVSRFVERVKPELLWDFGCNSGDYSVLALNSGAKRVVGFDVDQQALDMAFARAQQTNLPYQAAYFDAANPSPSQGWAQVERKGLMQREKPNAILVLAFIHHLSIARNIPLNQVIDWILSFANEGVIEFVGKNDPTSLILLKNREDIFDDYTLENFNALLSQKATIVEQCPVPNSDRVLFAYSVNR